MKTIAIIAHDGKKAEMVAFVKDHLEILKRYKLVATGSTGSHIEKTGLKVEKKNSGPLGGDAQIASDVVDGKVQAVIFLRDPLGNHPHDPDIFMLMRICDVHNIPLATNTATAYLIIKSLEE
ncbi:MAG: methylglyoxal synthase [Deltaproteobacteria bacterium]|nr:methylglyoxal synthase [Deltaproteobacteria bacterium]